MKTQQLIAIVILFILGWIVYDALSRCREGHGGIVCRIWGRLPRLF